MDDTARRGRVTSSGLGAVEPAAEREADRATAKDAEDHEGDDRALLQQPAAGERVGLEAAVEGDHAEGHEHPARPRAGEQSEARSHGAEYDRWRERFVDLWLRWAS